MDSSKHQLHALLDAMLRIVVVEGKSSTRSFEVPFAVLAEELKHYETPIETDLMNVRVTLTVKVSHEEEAYDTTRGFTIADKTRH